VLGAAFAIALVSATAFPNQGVGGILARDRALGESVARGGLGRALPPVLSDSAVLVYAGAPVIVGRGRIETLLRAQPALDSLTLHWAPRDGWLSAEGDFAVTYGDTQITFGSQTRVGTYISCWRNEAGAWRVVGLQFSPLVPPSATVVPNGVGPRELPALSPGGPAGPMIQADLDFAALAGKAGAPAAFGEFAAPEAVLIGGGQIRRGPDAIRANLAAGPASDWAWFPVVAHAAAAGDLGFTVGQAVIRPRSGGEPSYSKYLTVWRRGPDGRLRFLTDAGNPRPK
jgi:ketosteroid isomerase-like protein